VVCVPLPGSRLAIDRNKASTSAVNAVAAIAWCSMDSRVAFSRSGEMDKATNSSPTRAAGYPAALGLSALVPVVTTLVVTMVVVTMLVVT
jgi:hypothetical protein